MLHYWAPMLFDLLLLKAGTWVPLELQGSIIKGYFMANTWEVIISLKNSVIANYPCLKLQQQEGFFPHPCPWKSGRAGLKR